MCIRDSSKGKSDYQAFKDLNVKYTGSRSIKHNKEGFDEIVNLVRELSLIHILILMKKTCIIYSTYVEVFMISLFMKKRVIVLDL